jgi:shikimate kinase
VKDQIWLTGFMGTGKSRIVRPLAAALDWQAIDVDKLIEEEAGDAIPAIFQKGGEGAFRVLESQVIERIAGLANIVVATGGGTILAESNRALMHNRGFIVCLDARPETIAARIKGTSGYVSERPLLAGGDPLQKITEIKAARDPIYAQADFIIQTDDLTPDQVTHQVLTAFREHQAPVAGGSA